MSDGAVLLHVSDVAEGAVTPLSEARGRIDSILGSRLLEDELRASVEGRTAPEGSIVLETGELEEILRGASAWCSRSVPFGSPQCRRVA